MSRTILAAIGLIALAACGGGDKQATPRRPKAPAATSTQRVASKPKSAARSSQKAKGPQKKKAARPDTTTKRNPLTN
jgi:hypothetical protein